MSDRTLEELVEDYIALMDLQLDDDRLEWAWGTIEGIRRTVKSTGKINSRQMDVIDTYQLKIED